MLLLVEKVSLYSISGSLIQIKFITHLVQTNEFYTELQHLDLILTAGQFPQTFYLFPRLKNNSSTISGFQEFRETLAFMTLHKMYHFILTTLSRRLHCDCIFTVKIFFFTFKTEMVFVSFLY